MFFNLDDLGEKTLNKIAEIALARQFERVEKLSVKVKTDPNRLAKGELESLIINVAGMVTRERLRMQEIKMTFKAIAVSPFKALMGNIELTYPSQGYAYVVLTETDLESAFKVIPSIEQLQQSPISLVGKAVNIDIQQINCRVFSNDEIDILLKIFVRETSEIKKVKWRMKPCIDTTGKGIILDKIQCIEGEEISASFVPILEEAEKIFNLNLLQLDGISLHIERLTTEEGKLILKAAAEITHFPTN